MAVVCIWSRVSGRAERRKRARRRKERFGTDPAGSRQNGISRDRLDEIAVYYEETKEQLSADAVDEVTWDDLGMDEVFLRINQTESYIGEQVLYRRLHGGGIGEACAEKETPRRWERFERQIDYVTEHEEEREQLQEALFRIGKTREDYYLPMFLKNADMLLVGHLWCYRLLQLLLFGSLAAGLLTERAPVLALCAGTALVNLMLYTYGREKYEVYLYALGSVRQLLNFHRMLAGREEWRGLFLTEEQERASEDLQKLARHIGSFQRRKGGAMTGDILALAQDYLIGVTLWDITSFARIARLLLGRQEELFLLYEACGEVDLAVSVASFRRSLPGYCLPEPLMRGKLDARGLYHPLLSDPVRNDFAPEKNGMITGANASGKSTFLKAVAVNAVLAQTIHTASAEAFAMPRMRVITSMAVRDDLLGGESYYVRETGYLKRIVDAAQEKAPALCVIDEILRGTNTGERLAASEAVCRYLADAPGLVLVATHDMELAEKLGGIYESYHFKSGIREADILFDYRIYAGLAEDRNAIRLLAYLDFPEKIVALADRLYREQA